MKSDSSRETSNHRVFFFSAKVQDLEFWLDSAKIPMKLSGFFPKAFFPVTRKMAEITTPSEPGDYAGRT